MSELRALSKECGLMGYSRLGKDQVITFLRDSIQMETNHDDLRLGELRALVKEQGLQGYRRLKRLSWLPCLEIHPRNSAMSKTPSVSVNLNLEA